MIFTSIKHFLKLKVVPKPLFINTYTHLTPIITHIQIQECGSAKETVKNGDGPSNIQREPRNRLLAAGKHSLHLSLRIPLRIVHKKGRNRHSKEHNGVLKATASLAPS